MNPKHVSGYYNRDLFVYLLIFSLLVIACGMVDNQFVGDGLTRDDLFYESGVVYRVDYIQTANVSTQVDERMVVPVGNPCKTPYDMVCSKWKKSGSYLVDNARAIHDRRLTRALTHSAVKHPFLSTLYTQCLAHLGDPLGKEALTYMELLVNQCEPKFPTSELDGNMARLACYEKHAIFPLLDWRDERVQLSMWADAPSWNEALVRDTCGVLGKMRIGNGECIDNVRSALNILKHVASTMNEAKVTYAEWSNMVNGRIELKQNETTPQTVVLWNKEMMLFVISALAQPAFKWLLRAAAVGDMLQYAGHPDYFTMYNVVSSLNLMAAERVHPPSVYGWGPMGYSQIMVSKSVEEDEYHPDMMNVCLDGVGELLPQAIDQMIYPKQATIERVHALIHSIKEAYIESIKASDTLKESFKEAVVARFSEIKVVIGNNRPIHITDHGVTFLESALIARVHNRKQGSLAMPGNFHFDTFNAIYDPLRNRVFIPTLLTLSPFFNASDPIELQYGRLGALAGHELGHFFNRFVLQKFGLISGEDFRIVSNSLRCFENGYAAFNEEETLPDVMGFEMALRACQRAKGCSDGRAKMAFFAVYGQTLCENRDNGFGTHNAPADRVYMTTMLARNADQTGFSASLWSCSNPYTCAFWK